MRPILHFACARRAKSDSCSRPFYPLCCNRDHVTNCIASACVLCWPVDTLIGGSRFPWLSSKKTSILQTFLRLP